MEITYVHINSICLLSPVRGNSVTTGTKCEVTSHHSDTTNQAQVRCLISFFFTLPVVLYGCETWSLTFREEHRLRVFQNRVLRRIFGPKRDEVTGEWRILHNEELNDLYSSPNIIRVIKSRRMRWAGLVARMGEGRGAYRILVGRPEGSRPLGRPRRRLENNIKTDLQEVRLGGGGWHGLD
jgi:hypothetical protein